MFIKKVAAPGISHINKDEVPLWEWLSSHDGRGWIPGFRRGQAPLPQKKELTFSEAL
jgi:hypothetical protein